MGGHSDGDVLAHALTDAVLGAAGMEDIGALFPSDDPALAGADSIGLLREAWRRVREDGWELVNADVVLIGEEPRLAPHRNAMRERLADASGSTRRGWRCVRRPPTDSGSPAAGKDLPRRPSHYCGDEVAHHHAGRAGPSRQHAQLWPEFMNQDPIVSTFWPRLYELYPDFQFWVLDGKETVAYACTVPVRWDGIPEPRGIDWALSNGVAGDPSDLCAIVVGIAPEYRGQGLSAVLLRRMAGVAAAHGLDCMIAPVRPTWKERYPLTPIERYMLWRREDGLPYDPWLRTHERLGAVILDPAPRSMTVTGSRDEWEKWTGLQFPEDGDYVVPGALVPVSFEGGTGTYVEPNIWVRHPV